MRLAFAIALTSEIASGRWRRVQRLMLAAGLFVAVTAAPAAPIIEVDSIHALGRLRAWAGGGVAADLDGDGRKEWVSLDSFGDEYREHVLTAIEASGDGMSASAVFGGRSFRVGKLLVYRRTDHAGADGVALVGASNRHFSAGERFEGLPLRSVGRLPDLLLQPPVAIADVDGNGVLDLITRTVAGFNRWEYGAQVPLVESAVPICQSDSGNVCVDATLGNFDADAQLELLFGYPQLTVLDADDLEVIWSYPGNFAEVASGNVDSDPALEIVVRRSTGAAYEVLDTQVSGPVSTFPIPCFSTCEPGVMWLGDTRGQDGRAELLSAHALDGIHRLSLPDGQVDGPPYPGNGVVAGVVDLDGDGRDNLLRSRPMEFAPILELLESGDFTTRAALSLQSGGLQVAGVWPRPLRREFVIANYAHPAIGTLTSIDPDTGAVLWQFPTADAPYGLRGPLALAALHADTDSSIDIAVLTDAYLIAFSGMDRRELWRLSVVSDNQSPTAMAVGDLDGDGLDEAVLAYRDFRLRALRLPSGELLWTEPSIADTYAVEQLQWAQLDADADMELLASGSGGVRAVDANGSGTLFSSRVAAVGGVAVRQVGGQVELAIAQYVPDHRLRIYRAGDFELLREGALPQGTVSRALVAIGDSEWLVLATREGRLLAVSALDFRIGASTDTLGHELGLGAKLSVAGDSVHGVYRLAVGSAASFVEARFMVDAPMFRSGFESAGPQ